MVREVTKSIKAWLEEDTQILCILGGPFVGNTWLVTNAFDKNDYNNLVIVDNVNSYEDFQIVLKNKENDKRYVIIGRLSVEGCKKIVQPIVDDKSIKYVYVMPLTFKEFKIAMPKTYNLSQLDALKIYIQVGGLPEIVKKFFDTGDISKVRRRHSYLFEKIKAGLSYKERQILDATIAQEVSDNPGFIFREISAGAREREYGDSIRTLLDKGLIYKIDRFDYKKETKAHKYKFIFYDIGMWSAIYKKKAFDDNSLYSFYLRELLYYVNGKDYNIFYWIKQRAKARLSIVLEKCMTKKQMLIPVVITKKENTVPRNVQSFQKEYEETDVLYIKRPTDEMVEDGEGLFERISNIT